MELKEVINDSERLFIGKNSREGYKSSQSSEKTINPGVVALPESAGEVENLVHYAIEQDMKIIARGANTGVAGSQIPLYGNELIIGTSRMNKVIGLDEKTMTLTVEPGVILSDIQTYVEKLGYFYPPDPASKHSSIGGNVMTNAGGLRAVKYGTTRSYVRQLEVVLPTGEVVALGSLNIKDSSGYDLKDLFIGSEGTLGIITEIKLKLLPLPKHKRSMAFAFNSIKEGTDAVLKILASGIAPTALELFERSTIEYSEKFTNKSFSSGKGNTHILLTIDGDDINLINQGLSYAQQLVKELAVESIVLNTEQEKSDWDLRDNILVALMEFTEFEMLDEVVPIDRFAEMIEYTKELEHKHDLRVINFGHAGDGNIHTVLMKENHDKDTWQAKRQALLNDLYQKVLDLDGLPAAEHGIGTVKKPYLLRIKDSNEINMMRKIKRAIDPNYRMNPDKIF